MTPLIKWAGGKTKLLPELLPRMPQKYNTYYEPFSGGLALLLCLHPKRAVVGDSNAELINFYMQAAENPDDIMREVMDIANTEKMFNMVRSQDPSRLTRLQRATRFLYLNKTCFNGLWRVNSKGQFNVPYGRPKNPSFFEKENFKQVSEYLVDHVDLMECDFSKLEPIEGDFMYLDPPYAPTTKTMGFNAYTATGFNVADHTRLRDYVVDLDKNGVKWMLSNSDVPFTRDLYKNFDIEAIDTKRLIAARADARKVVSELIIRNYK